MPLTHTSDSLITRNLTVEDLLALAADTPLELKEMAAPATPPSGALLLYAKSDGKLYAKNDAGTEFDLTGGGGGATLPVGDDTALVKGSADDTKQVRLEVDGLSTGTTRVLTVPDSDLTLVGTDLAQTLANKTLATPSIASFASAQHDHEDAAGGGALSRAAVVQGGPLRPAGAVPDTSGDVYPNVHVSGSAYRQGLGVAASLAGDRTWHLEFALPPVLPAGTCKLVLRAVADATSGAAKVNPKWVSVADGEDPFAATRNAEGTTTLTWSGADADKIKESKVTLDADTPVGGETLVMDLVFETTGWTLAEVSTWQAMVIWE